MNQLKNITLLLIIITSFFACNSDDSTTTSSEDENRMILKKTILGDENGFETNFTLDGRLSYMEDKRIGLQGVTMEFFYDDQNRREKYTRYDLTPETSVEYLYDNSGKIIQIKEKLNGLISTNETVTNYTYDNNTITGTNTKNNTTYTYVFGFNDNSYKRLISYKVITSGNQETIFEETYEYSDNGNLLKNIIHIDKDGSSKSHILEYDDKKNPWKESLQEDYLNILLEHVFPNSLALELVNFASNNVITSFVDNYSIEIEYNENEYPVKRIESHNTSNDPFDTSITTFEYY